MSGRYARRAVRLWSSVRVPPVATEGVRVTRMGVMPNGIGDMMRNTLRMLEAIDRWETRAGPFRRMIRRTTRQVIVLRAETGARRWSSRGASRSRLVLPRLPAGSARRREPMGSILHITSQRNTVRIYLHPQAGFFKIERCEPVPLGQEDERKWAIPQAITIVEEEAED